MVQPDLNKFYLCQQKVRSHQYHWGQLTFLTTAHLTNYFKQFT